jgi:hypothetical protein
MSCTATVQHDHRVGLLACERETVLDFGLTSNTNYLVGNVTSDIRENSRCFDGLKTLHINRHAESPIDELLIRP